MGQGEAERRKRGRLSRSGDFERAYREGQSHGNRFLVLYEFPRPEGEADGVRLGISAGRDLGGAVVRNRVKRALREVFRDASARLPDGHDFVLVARSDLVGLVEREGTAGVRDALDEVIRESGLSRRSV
jgi:ribonuclease P protein component